MKSKRSASIQIETYEVTTVRRRPALFLGWCAICAAEVEMLSAGRAAEWATVPSLTISGWLEAGKLHLVETTQGWIYVCRNSLEKQVKEVAAVEGMRTQTFTSSKINPRRNRTIR